MKFQVIIVFISCHWFEQARGLSCDSTRIDGVRFNVPEKLLSKEDFDKVMNGALYGQIYLLIPVPPPFTPNDNYYCNVTQVDETIYTQTCTYGEPCDGYTVPLNLKTQPTNGQLLPGNEAAIFSMKFPNSKTVYTVAYWSSCPEKYVWKLECTDSDVKTKCSPENTTLGIFLRQGMSLDDAPLNAIAEDLEWTGVQFGSVAGFKWDFTHYEKMPCQM